MACTFPPTRWHDPGEVSVCPECEDALDKAADEEEAWNRGARMADDLVCQCCGKRGHSEITCPERCANSRSYR